jgi:hypothetical protein
VTSASELEDLAQMSFTADLLRGPLGREGYEIVLGGADNPEAQRRQLRLGGKPVGALYRYVPLESMLGTAAFTAVFEAASSGRLRLLNGLYGLLLQHKGLLAILREQRDDPALSQISAMPCANTCPLPGRLTAVRPISHARSSSPNRCSAGKVRRSFSVRTCPRRPGSRSPCSKPTLSNVASARALDAAVPTAGGPCSQRGHATVGSYIVAGHRAGFYTRFGGKVITSRAKWLAILTQPESLRS